MLKHLYKSHVRESLSPHQDKIQFSKSPNHYPNNTEVQLVYKNLSFGGWLYYTIFKLDTISHPYHSNCAFQSLLWRTSNFVINHEDLLVDSNLWLIHQWLTKMVTKHTDLCFFCLIRVSETQSSEICTWSFLMWFHTGSVLICCWGCNTRPLKSTSSREWFE